MTARRKKTHVPKYRKIAQHRMRRQAHTLIDKLTVASVDWKSDESGVTTATIHLHRVETS